MRRPLMQLHLHEWGERERPAIVCLHGVSAHGRRFRKLAEERLAPRSHVLAPDLRGHGRSGYEPPWSLETHLEDIDETCSAAGVERALWIGHSFGARLVLELAARTPDRIERAVLLDPAIELLPHVGLNLAEEAAKDYSFASEEEAVEARLAAGSRTPRPFLEEEAREHLVPSSDGRLRWRVCRPAVVTGYSEICTPPPPPSVLRMPTLLVHAQEFGLVREEQLEEYDALGETLERLAVPGGHIVYWDAYDEVADAVEEFLFRHEGNTHP